MINLEGGRGDYDLSLFTDIQDADTRDKVSDYFMKEGRVSGPECFAINNPEKVDLFGIEDADLYIKNVDVYRDSLEYIAGVNNTLDYIASRAGDLKGHIYSRALLELDSRYGDFRDNKVDLKEFIGYIFNQSLKRRLSLKRFPNIRAIYEAISKEKKADFKKANSERDKLIDELKEKISLNAMDELTLKVFLFKTGQLSQSAFYNHLTKLAAKYRIDLKRKKNLSKYITYINIYEEADKMEVFNEIDALYELIAEKELKSDSGRRLFKVSKNVRILKNIFNIRATRKEIDYFNKNKSDFNITTILDFITEISLKYGDGPHFDNSAKLIDQKRDEIAKFYKYTLARDEAFLKNIKKSHKRFKKDASILVAGGFHTENLTGLFKKNGLSYIVIRPTFKNSDDYDCPYFKLLFGGLSSIEEKVVEAISAVAIASLFTDLAVRFYGSGEWKAITNTLQIAKNICENVVVGKGTFLIKTQENGAIEFSLDRKGDLIARGVSAKDAARREADALVDGSGIAKLMDRISQDEEGAVVASLPSTAEQQTRRTSTAEGEEGARDRRFDRRTMLIGVGAFGFLAELGIYLLVAKLTSPERGKERSEETRFR